MYNVHFQYQVSGKLLLRIPSQILNRPQTWTEKKIPPTSIKQLIRMFTIWGILILNRSHCVNVFPNAIYIIFSSILIPYLLISYTRFLVSLVTTVGVILITTNMSIQNHSAGLKTVLNSFAWTLLHADSYCTVVFFLVRKLKISWCYLRQAFSYPIIT